MIKEKHLVPGRVLARLREEINWETNPTWGRYRTFKKRWVPFMVVSYYPDIKCRHARSTANVEGWEVLVIWLGETTRPVEHVRILPSEVNCWKLLF
jgi:hypothetical protein